MLLQFRNVHCGNLHCVGFRFVGHEIIVYVNLRCRSKEVHIAFEHAFAADKPRFKFYASAGDTSAVFFGINADFSAEFGKIRFVE